jgi:hypothetical protein
MKHAATFRLVVMSLKIRRSNFFKEKTMNKALIPLILVAVISGCSSTQYVPVANTTATIPEGKAIVQLHRVSSMIGAARGSDIYDGELLIGDIKSGGKLTWERDANRLLCLGVKTFNDTLIAYSLVGAFVESKHPHCFEIKESMVNLVEFDFPNGRFKAVENFSE